MSEIGTVNWSEHLEKYFSDTAERCQCLAIVHRRAEQVYARKRTLIDIPVIVISGLVGFMSVGSTSMFEGQEKLSSILLGICSLIVSVINTLGTYQGYAKLAEGHRIGAIQYARLYRFLSLELRLERCERMSPTDLLKQTKETYDRLQEVSPPFPVELISEFKKEFEKYTTISKPPELNGLEEVIIRVDNPMREVKSETFPTPKEALTLERN